MKRLPLFEGEALDFRETLRMLRNQGMEIESEERALYVLGNVSYCRLKSYMIPFMEDRSTHRFKPGTSFEKVYTLYGFDRRFRELIFHEMEKVEIAIRTRFGYLTARSEKGYWFTNPEHFRNESRHGFILRNILRDINHSDNDAIVRFREKYSNTYPPCWLTMEATSMGTLSVIYDEMVNGPEKKALADYFGLSVEDFASWLRHLVYVRNYCAHHSRLWDKKLSVRGNIPLKPRYSFPALRDSDSCHIYYTCCILKYLIDTVRPGNSFGLRLKNLIDGFPTVQVERPMGFPPGWRDEPLWKTEPFLQNLP